MAKIPHSGPYREITLPAILFGIISGILLAACFTYAGLLIGFTIGGSAVAAIIGFGVLRGLFKSGTMVENNIISQFPIQLWNDRYSKRNRFDPISAKRQP